MKRSETAVAIGVSAIVTAVFACGVKEEPAASRSGGASEAGASDAPPPVGVTVAPDGKGVCCPLDNPCSPGYRGGWAASAEECVFVAGYDGSFDRKTDDHGCVAWAPILSNTADLCCGCIRPTDASADVSDASSDAPDGD